MKKSLLTFGCIGAFLMTNAAVAVSAGTTVNDSARAAIYTTPTAGYVTNAGSRGQN